MSKPQISFGPVESDQDLEEILAIQAQNLPQHISAEEAKEQGFVTVHHNFDLLKEMNQPHAHAVARADGKVVGYTLVMLPSFGNRIPVLFSLFELIDGLTWQGKQLKEIPYFVMGQVAVDKSYRGMGIFDGLYQEMAHRLSPHFELIVTEIATRNTRSRRAHARVGFEDIHIYQEEAGEEWAVVAWPIP